jgi:hypothetical protein
VDTKNIPWKAKGRKGLKIPTNKWKPTNKKTCSCTYDDNNYMQLLCQHPFLVLL